MQLMLLFCRVHMFGQVRMYWLMLHLALSKEDESTHNLQKRGFVILSGNGRQTSSPSPFFSLADHRRFIRTVNDDTMDALPLKLACFNYFAINAYVARMLEHLLTSLDLSIRSRLIIYRSPDIHGHITSLSEYGVIPDVIPRELGGQLDFDFQSWLEYQFFAEKFDAGVMNFEDD